MSEKASSSDALDYEDEDEKEHPADRYAVKKLWKETTPIKTKKQIKQEEWDAYLAKREEMRTQYNEIVKTPEPTPDPTKLKVSREQLQKAFDEIDTDHNGTLDPDEFRTALVNLGLPNPEISDQLFQEIDLNHDGVLSFKEFRLATQNHPMVERVVNKLNCCMYCGFSHQDPLECPHHPKYTVPESDDETPPEFKRRRRKRKKWKPDPRLGPVRGHIAKITRWRKGRPGIATKSQKRIWAMTKEDGSTRKPTRKEINQIRKMDNQSVRSVGTMLKHLEDELEAHVHIWDEERRQKHLDKLQIVQNKLDKRKKEGWDIMHAKAYRGARIDTRREIRADKTPKKEVKVIMRGTSEPSRKDSYDRQLHDAMQGLKYKLEKLHSATDRPY